MKTKLKFFAVALLIAAALQGQIATVLAQGTAFTYQGRLNNNGAAANGLYDIQFSLYGLASGGSTLGPIITNAALGVTNGLFTTTLDFGGSYFTGNNVWLNIAVRTNGSGTFTTLSPRQAFTPAPYSIFAASAASAGNVVSGTNSILRADNNYNIFTGLSAGSATTGSFNTVDGYRAFASNSTGYENTADGSAALLANSTGYQNTAIGYAALYANTTGFQNTANGYAALYANTTGNYNTANGVETLYKNTNGTENVANGYVALYNNTIGSYNVATGDSALFANTTGSNNTATGYLALYENTTGNYNVAIGSSALYANTTGSNNTATGYQALSGQMIGTFNTAFGYQALASSGSASSLNTALGSKALFGNQGGDNTAIGCNALPNTTTASGNVGIGINALYSNQTGDGNIAIGNDAGTFTLGSDNIYIGNPGQSNDQQVIRIGNSNYQTATFLTGNVYGTTFNASSDRDAKEHFTPVDEPALLAKVVALPVTRWNYKTESADVQHIGPMAQDFQAAFGLAGKDDKHISMVDEGGVALAAIQALNQKLNEQLKTKDAELEKMEQRLEKLEHTLERLEHSQAKP